MPTAALSPAPSRAAAGWLDAAPLLGLAGGDRTAEIALKARAAQPEALARLLAEAIADANPEAIVAPMVAPFAAAWTLLPRAQRRPLWLVLPDVRGLVRESTEYGMAGAGARRMLRVGVMGLMKLGFGSLPDAPGVLRRDFPTLLRVLTRLEVATAAGLKAEGFFLQPQMTDLALAMGQLATLDAALTAGLAAGLKPGLATSNPQALRQALATPGPVLARALQQGLAVLTSREEATDAPWPATIRLVRTTPPAAAENQGWRRPSLSWEEGTDADSDEAWSEG